MDNKVFKLAICTFTIILLLISVPAYSQSIPTDYSLGTKNLKKSADRTPSGNSADRILIQDKNTIWLGTGSGLSKSTDNGLTWTNFRDVKPFNKESISALGYYDNTIWVATWHMEYPFNDPVPVGSGLKYSKDGGSSWTEIAQPVDKQTDTVFIYGNNKLRALPITIGQGNFTYQFAFTKSAVWIVSYYAGLRKSTDMGKTWQRVLLPSDNINSIKPTDVINFELSSSAGKLGYQNNLNHRAFSIKAVGDDTLYVGTAGGINKSTDGGISWTKFNHTNQAKPISGNHILALDRNAVDGTIWAATLKAEDLSEFTAVSYSTDGGRSWEITLADEKIRDFGFKTYASGRSDVFAAAESGLYRSNSNGKSWIAAPRIMDSQTKLELKQTKFLSVEANMLNNTDAEIWIGTDDATAKTTEVNTTSWSDNWKLFISSSGSVAKSESFAFPNPFQPSKEVVRIKYSLENAATVTLRIFDFGMNLVKTVLQNASRTMNPEQLDYWDGKDESNQIVTNGVYFYRLDIEGKEAQFGKIMVIR